MHKYYLNFIFPNNNFHICRVEEMLFLHTAWLTAQIEECARWRTTGRRLEVGVGCWKMLGVDVQKRVCCVLRKNHVYGIKKKLNCWYFTFFFYFDFVLWLNYIDLMFLFYSSSSTYPFICIHSFGFLLLLLILYVKRISRIDNTSQMGNTSEQRNHRHQWGYHTLPHIWTGWSEWICVIS